MVVSSKERLLKVREIFEKETDENNKLSIYDLMNDLKEEFDFKYNDQNTYFDKKAVLDDINELNNSGYSINTEIGAHNINLYYHYERPFEEHEIRMIIDAVSSARSITKDDTDKLVNKVKTLTSKSNARKLENRIHIDEMVKSSNNKLKYYLYTIHEAISENKRLSFQYGNYNVNKVFVLHHEGKRYTVGPYGLVWNSDFYYLVCQDFDKGKVINYRVDRMRNVNIVDEGFNRDDFNLANHMKECFNMYPGEVDTVKIEFNNQLVNAVIDRLGLDSAIIKEDEEHFTVRFDAAINEGLKRWVLNWGADCKVIYPEKLANMISEESRKMYEQYNV